MPREAMFVRFCFNGGFASQASTVVESNHNETCGGGVRSNDFITGTSNRVSKIAAHNSGQAVVVYLISATLCALFHWNLRRGRILWRRTQCLMRLQIHKDAMLCLNSTCLVF